MQRNFGIQNPRIAVAGLNPHAGEQGMMGDEEDRIITPAIEALRAEGFDVFGPVSPDALFTPRARQGYDLALCMYHDQGLIPLKAMCVDEGVNMSLGLPIIRTSPDHGTAFDIAGKDLADPGAMIAAIRQPAPVLADCPSPWRSVRVTDFSPCPRGTLRRASGSRVIESPSEAQVVDAQRFAIRLSSSTATTDVRDGLMSRSRTTHAANRRNFARTRRGAIWRPTFPNSGIAPELMSDSRKQAPNPRTTGPSGRFTNASGARANFWRGTR